MRFIHLSDLHIGKRVNDFSMAEDQRFILKKILNITEDEKADAVIIAGDVYDKSLPSGEAVTLFDDFLCSLCKMDIPVFIISGNHDSVERLSFGSKIFANNKIYISKAYNGEIEHITLSDSDGDVNVYMLPFIKPAFVRDFFPDVEIKNTDEAVRAVLSMVNLDKSSRNILIAHQFVTGAERSDSEEVSVGATDNVDAGVFDMFDYVALGHIHNPQNVGSKKVRYCGTPLKYSFSEVNNEKSVSVVDITKKRLNIHTVALSPLCEMIEITGKYDEVTSEAFREKIDCSAYIKITLTDEEDVLNALQRLRVFYPNIMRLEYNNKRTRAISDINTIESVDKKSPLELLVELYFKQNGDNMSDEQIVLAKRIFEEVGEEK